MFLDNYCVCRFVCVSEEFLSVQVPSKAGGPPEKKEVLLEEHDPIWAELRHLHIADVCTVLNCMPFRDILKFF